MSDIEKKQKEGEMGEDEMKRNKEQVEKYMQDANRKLDEIFAKKEAEIIN